MNYLAKNIKEKNILTIHKNATRNLIDVDDVKEITLNYILSNDWNKIVNVAYIENYTIPEIIIAFEKVFDFKIDLNLVDQGEHYSIDIHELNYEFVLKNKTEYLELLINKYYS